VKFNHGGHGGHGGKNPVGFHLLTKLECRERTERQD
jgi:hypothetical protein